MKKINKLLLVASGILASSAALCSCGNKEENTNEEQQTIVEIEKFDLAFLLDDSYSISEMEGFTLDETGYASIEKGTQVKFKITPKEGTVLGENGLIVKVNDTEIGEFDGFYKITMNKDCFVTVSGFVEETTKHRVTIKAPYGVCVESDGKTPFPDGSYLLTDKSFSFKLKYLNGFKEDDLLVKANGVEISETEGIYNVSLNEDVLIEISGISYQQTKVKMEETDLFIFDSIKGATFKNGYAYVTDEEVSFKLLPTVLTDVANSDPVVKIGETVLTPTDGIYSFTPEEDDIISVTGFKKQSVYSDKTEKTYEKEILADCAVINITDGQISGDADHLANISGGYKKATYYGGEYSSNQLSLNSNDNFIKYSYIEFNVNPFTGDYLEFFTPLKTNGALFYIHEKGWTNIKIAQKQNGDAIEYRYYVNGVDKGVAATGDMLISSLQLKMQGSYLFSEFVVQEDPSYVDPHYYSDVKALKDAQYVDGKDEETEFGTKKWYKITGSSYGVPFNFSSALLEKYNEIAFEIMPIGDYNGGPWFGFGAPGSTGGFKKDVTSLAIFTKSELGNSWNLVLKGTSTAEFPNLNLGTDLANSKMYLHPNKEKLDFLVSNFRFVDDPEYDEFGQKKVNVIADNLQHVSYLIEGHEDETSFKVDADTELTLTITPETGYDGIVQVNGSVIDGIENVYKITVSSLTTIKIFEKVHVDIVKVLDVLTSGLSSTAITDNCFAALDPTITTVYKNSKSSGSLFPSANADISSFDCLYFYVYNKENNQIQLYPGNSEQNCTTVGSRGGKYLIEIKRESDVWNFYCDGALLNKLSGKTADNLSALFYLQFWGVNYVSPLYGYSL